MTKKDKWLLWVVLILVVLPALRGIIKHDKKPIQRSVVWIEYKIDSAVAWVDNKIDTGIIYVFGETGEDILTREFGDRFTYDFIFTLKSLNNHRILKGEVTLAHDVLPIRPFVNKYAVNLYGNKGDALESLKLGCYWDYDSLFNIKLANPTKGIKDDNFRMVLNQRELSHEDFSEHHMDAIYILSSSADYMNEDFMLKKEISSYAVLKQSNSSVLVWDKTNQKEVPIDANVISSLEEVVSTLNFLKDNTKQSMEVKVVDLDSESGYTKELYEKTLLKGIVKNLKGIGKSSEIYLVNIESLTMSGGKWVANLKGRVLMTNGGFALYSEFTTDEGLVETTLIESKNQPIEECSN